MHAQPAHARLCAGGDRRCFLSFPTGLKSVGEMSHPISRDSRAGMSSPTLRGVASDGFLVQERLWTLLQHFSNASVNAAVAAAAFLECLTAVSVSH